MVTQAQMQAHVDTLIGRGALLHLHGCPTCAAIFVLPLTEQRALIDNCEPRRGVKAHSRR